MKKNFLFIGILYLTATFCSASVITNSNIAKKSDFHIFKANQNMKIAKKHGSYAATSVFADFEAIAWAKQFDIVELGGVDDKRISYDLLKNKDLLSIKHHIAYDWMPAFYYYTGSKNREFVNWLYKNREFATLNPDGPFLHCRENHYDWCEDYYYNLANKNVFDKRVKDLMNNMKSKGFNGVFFDWASGGFILEKKYSSLLANFKKHNPDKNYFKLVGKFYKELRDKKIFVVTNQAFRKHQYLLPFVSYDMTESYITTDKEITKKLQIQNKGWVDKISVTNYFPIYENSHTLEDSLHFIDLLTRYKKEYKKYGFKNFIYMNYLAPVYKKVYASSLLYREEKPKNGIYFSYAMAKLTDNIVYAEVPENHKLERDDIYFYKLGKPLGKSYEKLKSIGGYIRFYQNGFVLVSKAHSHNIYINIKSHFLPYDAKVYDAYSESWIQGRQKNVTLKLHFAQRSFKQSFLPLGRVYLYAH